MVKKAAIPLADAVRMASETPAKLIGIDSSKGTLQKGKSRRRFFCPHAKKRKPRGTCDAAGLLPRRRLPTLPLAQYHRRDEA